jgi:hypothetical protein
MSFLGMQPTFTQVPPRPQVDPAGEGLTKSRTATLAPNLAASLEAAIPGVKELEEGRGRRAGVS